MLCLSKLNKLLASRELNLSNNASGDLLTRGHAAVLFTLVSHLQGYFFSQEG